MKSIGFTSFSQFFSFGLTLLTGLLFCCSVSSLIVLKFKPVEWNWWCSIFFGFCFFFFYSFRFIFVCKCAAAFIYEYYYSTTSTYEFRLINATWLQVEFCFFVRYELISKTSFYFVSPFLYLSLDIFGTNLLWCYLYLFICAVFSSSNVSLASSLNFFSISVDRQFRFCRFCFLFYAKRIWRVFLASNVGTNAQC